ncbi:Arsenical pump membrane protein [Microbacterium ginsengisoli]|uniref:Arsenical pump membrane protein n=4 Tax=Microbacterium TaxID=33882 RepID=A0A0F0LR75_9MICO|nr:SLC13 family permease [Microbacterium ginsengisoli]KJL35712.1 Arsenical pump membrane protein [Microbacterium ginsengisoli]MBN9208959.1 arsenic transporter [Microbacterium ginsengisoli]
MKLAGVGAVLLVLSAIAVATGVLPAANALAIGDRVWPILLFVVAVTVVAELAAAAGVFDAAGHLLVRLSRGHTVRLWFSIVLLAVLATAFLSLDTTAVLLTPVVVAVARRAGLSPLPFAFATVWLANTASLALPVSNLTNLLAADRLAGGDPLQFLALMGAPALIAIVVTVTALLLFHRRQLHGRFETPVAPRIDDAPLLIVSAAVVVVMMPLLVSGLAPWIPALGAAVVLTIVFAVRSPAALRPSLLPWQLVLFAAGLFLAVGALEALGGAAVIGAVAGAGDDLLELWRVAASALVGANLIDNLPAYLALEQVAHTPARLGAVLVGVNAGPLITPWASLATLLWHARLRSLEVQISWRTYMLRGCLVAPLVVALATVPLAF